MMLKKSIILTFFVMTTCFLLNGCHWFGSPLEHGKKTKHLKAEELYKQGVSLATAKRYDKAIEAFNKALKIDPKYVNAYWGRGVARAMSGRLDEAIVDYDKALELNACHAWAYYNRGCAWRDKGNYDKAIDDFTRHLEIRPRDAEAYNKRAYAWANKGDLHKALADAKKACSLKPDNEIYQLSVKKFNAMINKKTGHTKE
jgi:tetratricopeptide (TPR) repeat protein